MSSPSAVGGPERVGAAGGDQLLVDDSPQKRLCVRIELARRRAELRVLENAWKTSLEFPRREEERPVDVLRELGERHIVHVPAADEPWR